MEHSIMPLFSSLKTKLERKTPVMSDADILHLADTITKDLDREGYELLYVIIRYYALLEDNQNLDELPYKPKINKTSLKYDFNHFPIKLIHIIYYFIELHTKKMVEEKQREIKNNP